jgi:hypothetical protein
VKVRDLRPGETMKGLGIFEGSEDALPVVVTSLAQGYGMLVHLTGADMGATASVPDYHAAGSQDYILTRKGHGTNIFHLYPH